MPKINDIREIKAAIFDLDGTLTNSAGMWLESRDAFFKDFGIQGSPDHKKAMISMGFDTTSRYVIDEFKLDNSVEEITQYWMDYGAKRYATDIELKQGVEEYFHMLHRNGVHICLATCCKLDLAHIVLDRHGIGHMFDYALCADDMGVDKSTPDVFVKCADHFGLPAGDCAIFEDSVVGICTAYQAGFYTVAIQDPHSAYALKTIQNNCDMLIEDFRELI